MILNFASPNPLTLKHISENHSEELLGETADQQEWGRQVGEKGGRRVLIRWIICENNIMKSTTLYAGFKILIIKIGTVETVPGLMVGDYFTKLSVWHAPSSIKVAF